MSGAGSPDRGACQRACVAVAAGGRHADRGRLAPLAALVAFALLSVAVLRVAPQLVEPDDYAYRASIVAMTQGHFLTLSGAQARALAAQLAGSDSGARLAGGPGGGAPSIARWQWVQVPDGRWISEKDPGYPYFAAPFQLLGIIRLAPLFYGALACLGLFFGARRWLGDCGGATAVGLFCSSGAALLFAWRDYMPTFTDASLIAAGTGALLWVALAQEVAARQRTWIGLTAFVALEAAVFVRYTNIVVLGCATAAVLVFRRLHATSIPPGALRWWLGSVALFGTSLAVFDRIVYGGLLESGYRPGEVTFSLSAVPSNLHQMPAHLLRAIPMLVLALVALASIAARRVRMRRADREQAADTLRDFTVSIPLAASWLSLWALYSAYTWTAQPRLSTLQTVRFYVPAIGAIALLGAWLVARLPHPASLNALAPVAVVLAMFGLGISSFNEMANPPSPRVRPPHLQPRATAMPGGHRSQGANARTSLP